MPAKRRPESWQGVKQHPTTSIPSPQYSTYESVFPIQVFGVAILDNGGGVEWGLKQAWGDKELFFSFPPEDEEAKESASMEILLRICKGYETWFINYPSNSDGGKILIWELKEYGGESVNILVNEANIFSSNIVSGYLLTHPFDKNFSDVYRHYVGEELWETNSFSRARAIAQILEGRNEKHNENKEKTINNYLRSLIDSGALEVSSIRVAS